MGRRGSGLGPIAAARDEGYREAIHAHAPRRHRRLDLERWHRGQAAAASDRANRLCGAARRRGYGPRHAGARASAGRCGIGDQYRNRRGGRRQGPPDGPERARDRDDADRQGRRRAARQARRGERRGAGERHGPADAAARSGSLSSRCCKQGQTVSVRGRNLVTPLRNRGRYPRDRQLARAADRDRGAPPRGGPPGGPKPKGPGRGPAEFAPPPPPRG